MDPAGAEHPDWTFAEWGPVYYEETPGNQVVYVLVTNQQGGNEYMTVLRSEDEGQTWFEPIATRPRLYTSNLASAHIFVFDNIIRVYFWNFFGKVSIQDFDMDTKTWGDEDASTEGVPTGLGYDWGGVMGVRRSDGTDVIFWQGPKITTKTAAYYMTRDGEGGWSASTEIDSLFNDNTTVAILLANNDRTYMFYRWLDEVRAKVLTPTNVLRSGKQVTKAFFELYYDTLIGDIRDNHPHGQPTIVGDQIYFPSVYNWDDENIPGLAVSSATDPASAEGTTPIFTSVDVHSERVPSYTPETLNRLAIENVCGVPWLLWATYTLTGNLHWPNSLYVSKYIDGVWDAPDEVLLPIAEAGLVNHDNFNSITASANPLTCQMGIVYRRQTSDLISGLGGLFFMETIPEAPITCHDNYVY
jgi:hypothetical protein